MASSRRYRDPLAADRRAVAEAHLRSRKSHLEPDQIDGMMQRVIRDRLINGDKISRDDFLRADIPASEIEPRFRRCLAAVQNSIVLDGG